MAFPERDFAREIGPIAQTSMNIARKLIEQNPRNAYPCPRLDSCDSELKKEKEYRRVVCEGHCFLCRDYLNNPDETKYVKWH